MISSSQPDLRLLDRLTVVQDYCLAVAGVIAAVILCAWLIPPLAVLMPAGWSLMKANTALCVLLSAGSMALSKPRRSDRQIVQGRVLAAVVLLFGASSLYEWLSGRIDGLDTLLASDAGAPHPGRMAVQTALFFILVGAALLFARARKNRLAWLIDGLNLGAMLLALVILSGYCFGAARLFGESEMIRTAPQTLLCLVLLAFACFSRRAEYGLFAVLIGVGIGSRIARILLPVALLLPFALAVSRGYATSAGWLSAAYATALTASITTVLLFLLVLLMAWRINDLERELRNMSLTDDLTKVYNHRGFQLLGEQALREARRAESPLTVLFFDLDGLKHANDVHGHDVGSQLIADMAELLRRNFRDADIVARVGGDEFAVITHADHAAAQAALRRLHKAAADNGEARRRPYAISYSVGESAYAPDTAASFTDLVSRADAAMYAQKRAKKAAQAA